jgi:hypothetical protein
MVKMQTEDVEFEIPQPPVLPIGPQDGAALECHTYKGKVIACTCYFPATRSGGIYGIAQRCWFVWGPATPEEFQRYAANLLAQLGDQADAALAAAN